MSSPRTCIDPMNTTDFGSYDVVVVGSGAAGSSAAIASARSGASTLLVEKLPFLGGNSTAVLDTFYGFFTPGDQSRKVVGGIGDDVLSGLESLGPILYRPNTYGAGTGVTYVAEHLKVVWESLVTGAGCRVLLHAFVQDATVSDGRITDLLIATKAGLVRVHARVVIDASGDADVCHQAGFGYELAGSLGPAQTLTTTFRMANVDSDLRSQISKDELHALMVAAADSGDFDLPRREGSDHATPIPNVTATDDETRPGRTLPRHPDQRNGSRVTHPSRDGWPQTGPRVRSISDRSCTWVRARISRCPFQPDRAEGDSKGPWRLPRHPRRCALRETVRRPDRTVWRSDRRSPRRQRYRHDVGVSPRRCSRRNPPRVPYRSGLSQHLCCRTMLLCNTRCTGLHPIHGSMHGNGPGRGHGFGNGGCWIRRDTICGHRAPGGSAPSGRSGPVHGRNNADVTNFVRTVLGDVPPDELGVTYLHEHLIIDSPLVAETMPHIHLPHVDDAVRELGSCRRAGVGAVVDTMPAGSGRVIERLAEVSRRTGVHVVGATGLHTAKYYETVQWANTEGAEQLAERFVADVQVGIDRYDYLGPSVERTPYRAGVIKVATSAQPDSHRERRLFEAAAIASKRTGAPILTHCEDGLGALRQVEMLVALGVSLDRVVMSHTDKVRDRQYHRDLLEAGVRLEYDQALRQGEAALDGTAALLRAMIDEGYIGQLMLGTDGARRTLWTSLDGHPGLAWLASGFRDVMNSTGIGEAEQQQLFVENPKQFLAFVVGEPSAAV